MNVQQVVTNVKRVFGDEAGIQITDDDIISWINSAQEDISNDNPGMLETTGVASIISGQPDYDMPADMVAFRSLQYNGVHLNKLSFNEFNEYLDGFRKTNPPLFGNGIPDCFMMWNNRVTLFPTPNVSITNGLVIYYIRHPSQVVTFGDPLTVPVQYHKAIIDYCLRQAYELDEDTQKATIKKTEYDERVLKMSYRNQEDMEFYPRITTLPDDENFGSWGFWGGYY